MDKNQDRDHKNEKERDEAKEHKDDSLDETVVDWQCERCTFSNIGITDTCAVCESPRGVVTSNGDTKSSMTDGNVQPNQQDARLPADMKEAEDEKEKEEPAESEWACVACTLVKPLT